MFAAFVLGPGCADEMEEASGACGAGGTIGAFGLVVVGAGGLSCCVSAKTTACPARHEVAAVEVAAAAADAGPCPPKFADLTVVEALYKVLSKPAD